MAATLPKKNSARYVAARAIAEAAQHFPNIDAQSIDVDSLDVREARLALAIHRTVLQRWLTIEYLLNGFLRKQLRTMEPSMQGILLTAGAQLLFMDRLPAHAVVDESVKLARGMVRVGATGLVNAVLRRISEMTDSAVHGKPWTPAMDRLPLEDGFVPLRVECLPDVSEVGAEPDAHELNDLEKHLSVAASHPPQLVRRWIKEFGPQRTTALVMHGVRMPPLVVAVEAGFVCEVADETVAEESAEGKGDVKNEVKGDAKEEAARAICLPHEEPGFVVWDSSHIALKKFLRENPDRRVQDVTASKAVAATADVKPAVIVDYCAGRGTKTRQLMTLHPQAKIIATDTDDERRGILRGAFGMHERVRVVEVREVAQVLSEVVREVVKERAKPQAAGADLLVLDVPCTNTGVLARRPEARYRFNEATLKSLVKLQRSILEKSWPLLAAGGHLLYSTCSIDAVENEAQVKWILESQPCELVREELTLPSGTGGSYRDGGYFALLKKQ